MFSSPSRTSTPSSYSHTCRSTQTIIISPPGQRGYPAGGLPRQLCFRCTCRHRRSQHSQGEHFHRRETRSGWTHPLLFEPYEGEVTSEEAVIMGTWNKCRGSRTRGGGRTSRFCKTESVNVAETVCFQQKTFDRCRCKNKTINRRREERSLRLTASHAFCAYRNIRASTESNTSPQLWLFWSQGSLSVILLKKTTSIPNWMPRSTIQISKPRFRMEKPVNRFVTHIWIMPITVIRKTFPQFAEVSVIRWFTDSGKIAACGSHSRLQSLTLTQTWTQAHDLKSGWELTPRKGVGSVVFYNFSWKWCKRWSFDWVPGCVWYTGVWRCIDTKNFVNIGLNGLFCPSSKVLYESLMFVLKNKHTELWGAYYHFTHSALSQWTYFKLR